MAIDHNSNNAQAEYKKLNGKRVDVLLPPDSYRLRLQLDAYSELDEYNLKYSASAYSENVTITGDTTITTDVLNVQITAETNALNGASNHLALYAHFKKSVLRSYGLPENIQEIPSNIQGEDRKKLEALIGSSTFYDFAVKMGMCQNYNPVVYDSGKGEKNERSKALLRGLYQARINSGYAMHYYMSQASKDPNVPQPNFAYFNPDQGMDELNNVCSTVQDEDNPLSPEEYTVMAKYAGNGAAANRLMSFMRMTPFWSELCGFMADTSHHSNPNSGHLTERSWSYGVGPVVNAPQCYTYGLVPNFTAREHSAAGVLQDDPAKLTLVLNFISKETASQFLKSHCMQSQYQAVGGAVNEYTTTLGYNQHPIARDKTEDIIYSTLYTDGSGFELRSGASQTTQNSMDRAFKEDIAISVLGTWVGEAPVKQAMINGMAKYGVRIGGFWGSLGLSVVIGFAVDALLLEGTKKVTDEYRAYLENFVKELSWRGNVFEAINKEIQGAKGTPERKRLIEALKYMQKSLSKCEKDASVSNQHRLLMYVLVSKALSDLESGESDFADCATSLYKAMRLPNPDGAGAALIDSVNDINAAGYNAFADALLFDVYTMALSYYDTHMELEGQKAQTNETGYSATNTDRENIVRNKYNANGLEERTNAFDVGTGRARDFWHLSPFFRPAIGKMVEPLINRVENNPTEWPDEDGRNDVYRTHRLAVMNSLISDQQPNMILDVSRTDRLTLAYRQGVDTDVTEGLFSKFCYKKATEYSASLPPEYVDIDFESAQSYYDILPEKPNWGSGKQQHFNFLQTIRSYAYSGRALYIEQHIGKIFPDRAKRSASIQTGGMSQYQLALVYRAEADVCEDILFVFADAFKNSSRLKSRSFRTFCKSHPFLSQYVTKDGKIDESLFRVEVSGEMTLEAQEARANALEGRCCDIIRAMEDYNLYTYRSQLYASDKKNQLCDKQIEEKVSKVLDNIKQTGAYPKFLNMFDGADDTQREAQGTTFLKAFYTVALADYYMLTPEKRKEFLLSYGVNVDPIAFFKEKGVDLNEVMTDLRIGDVSSIQQHKALLQEWVNANNGVGGAKNQLDQSNKNKQERNPNPETKPVTPKNNGNKVDESDRIQLNSLCEQMEKQYATIENTIYASGMMEWCALGAGGMVAWCALKSSVHYLEGQKIKCTQKQIKKAVNSAFKNGKLTEQGLAEALKKHAGLSDNVAKQCATHAIQEAESATQVLSRCSDTLQSNFTDDLKKVMNIADETKRMKAFKSLSKKYGLSRYDRQLLAYQVRTRNWEKAESMMPENLRIYKDRRGNMFVRGVKKTWNMSWKAFGYAMAAMVAIDLFKDDGYDAEFAKLITMAVDVGGMSQSEAEMYFSNEAYIKCRCTLDYLVENGYISETQWNKYVKVIENPNVFEPDVQYQLRKSLIQAFDIIDKVERENQTTNAVTHADLTQILDPFNVKHSQQLETPAYQRGLGQGQSMA